MFTPHTLFERVFAVGIIGKGVNGVAELVGGLLLLFVRPDQIYSLVVSLTQGELGGDPHDFVASHLLHTAQGLNGSSVTFGAIYLLAHGLVKVVLVVAILRDKLWAYPWMIVVLGVFIGYQVYRIALAPTIGLVALTVFDVVIVALTVREYGHRRRMLRPGTVRTDLVSAPSRRRNGSTGRQVGISAVRPEPEATPRAPSGPSPAERGSRSGLRDRRSSRPGKPPRPAAG